MIKRLFTVVAFLCATTVSLTAQEITPEWYKKGGSHFKAVDKNSESNFTMAVMGTIDGERCDSAFEIGVFCGEECRLSVPIYSSDELFEYYNFYSKLTVNGENKEKFSFRLYDHRNNVEVAAEKCPEEITFTADKHYGSFNTELYELAYAGSTTHRTALAIDDANDLSFSGKQYSITAEGIACSYTRIAHLDGSYETIVLPFDADITAIKAAGFVFEKYYGFEENVIKFGKLADNENLKAGVPYLFRYAGETGDGTMEVEFTANVQQVSGNLNSDNEWRGTFKHMDGKAVAGKYILNAKGDKMQKVGNNASLAPYHCYWELTSGTDASELHVSHHEYITGIEYIQECNHSGLIFDLNGRILDNMPSSGIIIKNNKKIYIK